MAELVKNFNESDAFFYFISRFDSGKQDCVPLKDVFKQAVGSVAPDTQFDG